MKRSNIIFFSLLAILYFVPLLIFGISNFIPVDKSYTDFGYIKVLQIDNPALKPDDIKVDTTFIPVYRTPTLCTKNDFTYLYYKGTKQYLPEVSGRDSTLIVKGAIESGQDKNLTLHIRINNLKKIILNDQEIWIR
ncbi:hypothetical protein [Parabacteroides bouchesdurhonensis]|uniref:hypothetical protein n=1 Tax=Parabacteroides bouchesdurhonensis TaxID=1936995 RepID=UPI000E516342|nr:hypothetical protein [Parabacteroides bouchesdurhonensis]RHJ91416.1 hypothetical protein DW095_10565 [Bacteroides sp. AM07-16]